MVTVEIDLSGVKDLKSFHDAFSRAMGFPDFYGDNMNAWEDCMSDLSKPDIVGMTRVQVPKGEDLLLVLKGAMQLRERQPEIFGSLIDSTAHVNQLKMTIPGSTRLLLLPL